MENEKLLKSIKKIVSDEINGVKKIVADENEKLAGMVQRGFLTMDKRFDKLDGRMGKLETRMASVEYNQDEMLKKLDGIAYKYELEELRLKFDRRIRALELKTGLKTA